MSSHDQLDLGVHPHEMVGDVWGERLYVPASSVVVVYATALCFVAAFRITPYDLCVCVCACVCVCVYVCVCDVCVCVRERERDI